MGLCSVATSGNVDPSQEVLGLNEDVDWACVVNSGQIQYHLVVARLPPKEVSVLSGQWICEHALLICWNSQGSADATDACEVITITLNSFTKVMNHYPEVADFTN